MLPFSRLLRSLLIVAFFATPLHAWAATTKITLLLVCDTYEMDAKNGRGGYPKIAGVAAAERAKGGNLLFFHAGDAYSPTLMSGFDRGENVVDLLNLLKLDVFVPGNHEYDFGPEVFRKNIAQAKFAVLAANLREPNGERVKNVQDTKMVQFGDVKVGIVGLTAQDSVEKSKPGDLVFSEAVATLKTQAADLRAQGADLIVAVAHAERAIDQRIIESRAADVLLSGDDHDLWLQYDGRTVGAEAKQDGEYMIAIDLSVDVETKGGKRDVSWWPSFRVIDTMTAAPDAAVEKRVADYGAELSKELDVPLATTRTSFNSRSITVRSGEAAIGNLYTDAIRAVTGADVALLNGGSFRAGKSYVSGSQITRRDVLTELPFSNKTMLLEMTGAELRTAIEHGLVAVTDPSGRFPQVSGLALVVDPTAPAGRRIVSAQVGGEPLSDTRRYKVATNDFLLHGGDGYALAGAKLLVDERSAKLIANDVMVYLREKGEISPQVEGRITLR